MDIGQKASLTIECLKFSLFIFLVKRTQRRTYAIDKIHIINTQYNLNKININSTTEASWKITGPQETNSKWRNSRKQTDQGKSFQGQSSEHEDDHKDLPGFCIIQIVKVVRGEGISLKHKLVGHSGMNV